MIGACCGRLVFIGGRGVVWEGLVVGVNVDMVYGRELVSGRLLGKCNQASEGSGGRKAGRLRGMARVEGAGSSILLSLAWS